MGELSNQTFPDHKHYPALVGELQGAPRAAEKLSSFCMSWVFLKAMHNGRASAGIPWSKQPRINQFYLRSHPYIHDPKFKVHNHR